MRIFASVPKRLVDRARKSSSAIAELGNEFVFPPESVDERFKNILSSDAMIVFHDGEIAPESKEDAEIAKEQGIDVAYSRIPA